MLQGNRDTVEEEYRLVVEHLMLAEKEPALDVTLYFRLKWQGDECQLSSEIKRIRISRNTRNFLFTDYDQIMY